MFVVYLSMPYSNLVYVGAAEITQRVSDRLSSVMIAASEDKLINFGVQTARLVAVVFSHLNPFKLLFDGINVGRLYDAIDALTKAIASLIQARALRQTLIDVQKQVRALSADFAKNKRAITRMQNMVTTLMDQTDEDVIHTQARDFIEAYGAYSPAVTNQDFVKVASLIEILASQACDLLFETEGVNIIGETYGRASKHCIYVGADAAVLRSYYEDI